MYYILIVFWGLLLLIVSCQPKKPEEAKIDKHYSLYLQNKKEAAEQKAALDSTNILYLARAYQEFVKKYPKNPKAAEYLYEAAKLHHFDLGDFTGALRLYLTVYANYPEQEELNANSLLAIAQIYHVDLKNFGKAEQSYAEFVERYPNHPKRRLADEALLFFQKSAEELAKNIPIDSLEKAKKAD